MSHTPEFPEGFHDEDFQDAARHASDNRECVRLLGLSFLQKGLSEVEVARLLEVHAQTVFDWLHRYKLGSIEAIKDKGGRGRKNTLDEAQKAEFKKKVLDLQEQRQGGRITARDVKTMMKENFKIECVNSTVYKLMHKVGLSWISGRTRHQKQNLEEQESYKKKFKSLVRQLVPDSVDLKNVDIWFQDEGRFGQQNTISRVWAIKGSRPGLIRQRQFLSTYLFGAVCPERDIGVALVLPTANSEGMTLHLSEIAKQTQEGRHAGVIIDNAGYHHSGELPKYDNLTLIPLPAYATELNSAEELWEWLRDHDLSNQAFKCYDDIVNKCCDGWNNLVSEAGRLRSLCSRSWAIVS
ncbi:IS630 family transposase [Endozoicomonas sp.]|uniref:IS630 family transposase n=1 Tax=Endozoicomonas sp. TaxID=1892382 RepID=UPI00383B5EEF